MRYIPWDGLLMLALLEVSKHLSPQDGFMHNANAWLCHRSAVLSTNTRLYLLGRVSLYVPPFVYIFCFLATYYVFHMGMIHLVSLKLGNIRWGIYTEEIRASLEILVSNISFIVDISSKTHRLTELEFPSTIANVY